MGKPVNDARFLGLGKERIDTQDQFFHTFFVEQARRDKMKGISRHKSDKSTEDLDEDEGFEMLENSQVAQLLEDGFSTDPEEEEFVDKLALSLMEEVVDDEGSNLDDEDPDMNGWENLNQEDDEDEQDLDAIDSNDEIDSSDDDGSQTSQSFADEDAFMDNSDSSEDEGDDLQYGSHLKSKVNSKRNETMNDDIFASAEDYEHLIEQPKRRKKSKT